MPMRDVQALHPRVEVILEPVEEEEEVVDETIFDPEAGKASDDPFAHLKLEDAPEDDSAASEDEEVSEYVEGEEDQPED